MKRLPKGILERGYSRLVVLLLAAWWSLPSSAAPTLQNTNAAQAESEHSSRWERRQKHLEEFLRSHSDSSGNPRPDLWRKAIEDAKRMKAATNTNAAPAPVGPSPKIVVGTRWTQIGPVPLRIDANQYQGTGPDSGEVTDIAIDSSGSSDQVIYICANDGGIWESSDGGASWQPKTDSMPSVSMGAVALDPGNPSIVYAGTGNYFNNGFFKGVGIYRSTDGGDNWTIPAGSSVFTTGSPNSLEAINRIVVSASGMLLVGTYTLKAGGGITGGKIYKSVDGGDHFGSNFPYFNNNQPVLASGGIGDIDLDTVASGTVYVSVRNVGLLKSTNSGTTFGPSMFDANVPPFVHFTFAQSTTPDNQTMYVQHRSNHPRHI